MTTSPKRPSREAFELATSVLVLVWLPAMLLGACGGGEVSRPTVQAAESSEAEARLRAIERAWEVGSAPERAELESDLRLQLREFGRDPSSARARVLLGQLLVEQARLDEAERTLAPVLIGPRGPTRDLALLVYASIRNRRGDPEGALGVLNPLTGKLLSGDARERHGRERSMALLALRRWRGAVDAMITWVAESGQLERSAKTWVKDAVRTVPSAALARQLEDWPSQRASENEVGARDWLRRVVVEHLTLVALEKKDPRLARDLLESAPAWLRASEAGEQLALLAVLVEGEAKVLGRTVGFVVGGVDERSRARSSRALMGLMRGLQLRSRPGSDRAVEGVELLVEEARGSFSAALGTLSGLGASVLVAAVDDVEAVEAIVFAESHKVPVITLSRPLSLDESRLGYAFVFGTNEEVERRTLEAALDRSEGSAVRVLGGRELPCPDAPSRPGEIAPAFEEIGRAGQVAIVLGDPACASAVVSQLDLVPGAAPILLGLEATAGRVPKALGRPVRFLSAGRYPASGRVVSDDAYDPAEERAGLDKSAGWYERLALDVAELVDHVLSDLPTAAAADPSEVRRRHDYVRDALLRAEGDLVTTDARGFSARHEIARTLDVRLALPSKEARK